MEFLGWWRTPLLVGGTSESFLKNPQRPKNVYEGCVGFSFQVPTVLHFRMQPLSDWPSDKMVDNLAFTVKSSNEFLLRVRALLPYSSRWLERDHRITAMVLAQSLMNSARGDSSMREELYPMYKMILSKFYTYTGSEFPFEFISRFRKAFTGPDTHASKIQRAFRKSQGYAEWSGHPDRLKAQGFFELEI